MHDYDLISFDSKAEMLEKSKEFWNPDKTQFWSDSGVDLVIDRREGYFLWDMNGRRLIDVHLNGGTYNLGHRNPEVVGAVKSDLDRLDMGNHHFPSQGRTAPAKALPARPHATLPNVAFAPGGGEAMPLAPKNTPHALHTSQNT